MSVAQTMVWFCITAVAFFLLLGFGVWQSTRATNKAKAKTNSGHGEFAHKD